MPCDGIETALACLCIRFSATAFSFCSASVSLAGAEVTILFSSFSLESVLALTCGFEFLVSVAVTAEASTSLAVFETVGFTSSLDFAPLSSTFKAGAFTLFSFSSTSTWGVSVRVV